MNNTNQLLKELDKQELKIKMKREALLLLAPKIADFKHDLSISFGGYPEGIDFDCLDRLKTVDLISHMKAGKWDKSVSHSEGKMDYVNRTLLPLPLRIYGAEPPSSCKIVEVQEEIPAQPARTVTRKKVVCKEHILSPVV